MNLKDKIEKLYNMDFKDVINVIHIEQGKSVLQISKETGVSRKSITNLAERLGLKTRNSSEAGFTKYKNGFIHPRIGTKDPAQSEKMIKNNPMRKDWVAEKRAISMQRALIKRELPQEILFKEILDKLNIKYEYQKPIGRYNADFFIQEKMICIEIDSTKKLCIEKKNSHKTRDAYFSSKGIKTIRIDKDLLNCESKYLDILRTNNIID